MRFRFISIIALLVFSLASQAQPSASEDVTLNLKDSDINAVIATVSRITGRNFLVDPRVKGRINIVSSKPLKKDELYDVFLSILEVHGFAAVDDGKVVKIIPNALAKQRAITTSDAVSSRPGDDMVTRIFSIDNVDASQLPVLLRPLIPPEGHITHYGASNILLITDRASNLERLAQIIRRIDQASDDKIEMIALQYASASQVVGIINSLDGQAQSGAEKSAKRVSLIADNRTNSILVSGDRAAKLRIRSVIAHLDTPLQSGGNTQVIYLKYAKAEEIAGVLKSVAGDIKDTKNEKEKDKKFSIYFHNPTNSLIITANPEEMVMLRSIIQQLDIRRAQVLIEAVIAEVSDSKASELGIQFRSTVDPTSSGILGGTNFSGGVGINSLASDPLAAGDGLSLGLFDGTKSVLGTNIINVGLLIRALNGDADTNIISTPSLITMDNQKAEITVADNVPFVTGQYSEGATNRNEVDPFQTIERQDVGLILKVKPQINDGTAIKLEIEQEVSTVSNSTAAVDLITSRRVIKTAVMAEDGQMIVLGGLIDDSLRHNHQQIPGLGEMPVFGGLFRSNSTEKTNRNLMVFIRPVIIRDAATAASISHGKYDYIRAIQQQYHGSRANQSNELGMPMLKDRSQIDNGSGFVESLRAYDLPEAAILPDNE